MGNMTPAQVSHRKRGDTWSPGSIASRKSTKEEHDMKKIYVLMSNDFDSEIPLLLRGWSFRDSIDKFYQRSKDELGFDQCDAIAKAQNQVRGDRAIRRHWYFLCIAMSYFIVNVEVSESGAPMLAIPLVSFWTLFARS